jgi:hypothetical protein
MLILGWQDMSYFLGTAEHVYADLFKRPRPSSLIQALDPTRPDHSVWHASYKEEYDGLRKFDTFDELSLAEYRKLAKTRSPAILSTCVLITKKDENGNPIEQRVALWFWVRPTPINGPKEIVSPPSSLSQPYAFVCP